MSERGVFAVDRGVWEHPCFAKEPFSEREAFLWLVSEASFKPRRVRVASVIVELQRGQISHSLRFMAAKWSWSEPRVRRFLARLKSDAMIDVESDAGATRVTICNYDRYQRVSLPSDAAPTQERRKVEDTKNTKEETEAEASVLSGFDEFWSVFPKRNGSNSRKNAEGRYRSAIKAGVSPSLIIGGAKRYASHCASTGKAGTVFVKMAEAWLNGRLWESAYADEPTTGPPVRRTFGQIARESAAEIAGYRDEPDRQADEYSGPTLDLVAGGSGADIVDLHSRRSGGF
jgi:hypothetical protein